MSNGRLAAAVSRVEIRARSADRPRLASVAARPRPDARALTFRKSHDAFARSPKVASVEMVGLKDFALEPRYEIQSEPSCSIRLRCTQIASSTRLPVLNLTVRVTWAILHAEKRSDEHESSNGIGHTSKIHQSSYSCTRDRTGSEFIEYIPISIDFHPLHTQWYQIEM